MDGVFSDYSGLALPSAGRRIDWAYPAKNGLCRFFFGGNRLSRVRCSGIIAELTVCRTPTGWKLAAGLAQMYFCHYIIDHLRF